MNKQSIKAKMQAGKLAQQGFKLFPLIPRKKQPLRDWNYLKATNDAQTVSDWYTGSGFVDIGLNLAASRLLVVDIDNHKEKQFRQGVNWLRNNCPAVLSEKNYAETTPNGGLHVFFKLDGVNVPATKKAIYNGVELITNFITVAPSVGYQGRANNQNAALNFANLQPAPPQLLQWLKTSPRQTAANYSNGNGLNHRRKYWAGQLLDELAAGESQGGRHNYLCRVLGMLLASGAEASTVATFYAFAVDRLGGDFPVSEARQIFDDITNKHKQGGF